MKQLQIILLSCLLTRQILYAQERNISIYGHFDLEFKYGCEFVETDTVLHAFKNDNIPITTNLKFHTTRVAYKSTDDLLIKVTGYFWQRDRFDSTSATNSNQAQLSARLNLIYSLSGR